MRKNFIGRKSLRGVFVTYEVRGLNLDLLINTAKKKGVDLYEVKKFTNKRLIVTVSLEKSAIFFAIAKEMCYNVRKVGEKGKAYPLLLLWRSLGLVIGAVVFSAFAIFMNDFILGISFLGSGSVYKNQVQEYLTKNGVVINARFSHVDLEKLEDGILADNPHLSFVSCSKRGNTLAINMALAKENSKRLSGDVYQMISTESGIVESIKVYRGTAQVKEGDHVEKGALLVDGYAIVKEQTLKINVLASVVIRAQKQFTFTFLDENSADKAIALCKGLIGDVEDIKTDIAIKKSQDGTEYEYEVTATYKRIIYAG